jgi:hypothetical protein
MDCRRDALLLRKTAPRSPPPNIRIVSFGYGPAQIETNMAICSFGWWVFFSFFLGCAEDILNAVGCPGDVQKGGTESLRVSGPANKNVLRHSGNGWIFRVQSYYHSV